MEACRPRDSQFSKADQWGGGSGVVTPARENPRRWASFLTAWVRDMQLLLLDDDHHRLWRTKIVSFVILQTEGGCVSPGCGGSSQCDRDIDRLPWQHDGGEIRRRSGIPVG